MMMDDYKNFDNFKRTEGCKMISPHHSHPTKGVRPVDSMSGLLNAMGYDGVSLVNSLPGVQPGGSKPVPTNKFE